MEDGLTQKKLPPGIICVMGDGHTWAGMIPEQNPAFISVPFQHTTTLRGFFFPLSPSMTDVPKVYPLFSLVCFWSFSELAALMGEQ